jgi:hypothetical protein
MPRKNVVQVIPMDVIWDEDWRVLEAQRLTYLTADQVDDEIGSGTAVWVATLDSDLVRLSGSEAHAYWKNEVQPRLVSPEAIEKGVNLDDYPDGYCYEASKWAGPGLRTPIILFEESD